MSDFLAGECKKERGRWDRSRSQRARFQKGSVFEEFLDFFWEGEFVVIDFDIDLD